MARPQRVAVIGAGHYHSTWYPAYLQILQDEKVDIVGIHDPDAALADDRAKHFDSVAYTDYRRMLEETNPEFVIALGRHIDMPEYFRFLVDASVPFLMEKPWAVDEQTFKELVRLAESRKTWVAAPLPMRHSRWAEVARAKVQSGELGAVSHIVYRMVRPGVQRYIDQGCEWMLSKREAGGGVLMNLGCHGFDLCRFITGEEAEVISAVTSHAVCKLEIEDYAFVTLRTQSGIIFHNEVGYTMPKGHDDNERKVVAEKGVLLGTETGLRIMTDADIEVIEQPDGYVGSWHRVVVECLDRVGRGDPPPVTLQDCDRAISLIYDSYRMAGER
jgi:predicted dehydrogenase